MDVGFSKIVGYVVLAPPPGATFSKQTAYAVLAPILGATVTKSAAYAVLGLMRGANVSKEVGYAVLDVVPPIEPHIKKIALVLRDDISKFVGEYMN